MKNLVSVAIPAYKALYLKEAIQSVLQQTYTNFELIIINDASPEDIDSIVLKFSDKRIKYLKNLVNLGRNNLVDNWNKCLSQANGEYFVLFSDDDIYDKDFLKELVTLADKFPTTNVFHCRVKVIDGNGSIIMHTPLCPEWEDVSNFIWHRIKGFRNQYAPDFMVRTKQIKEIGGFVKFPLAWYSDDATWFYLAKEGGVAYCDRALCNWRKSEINISKIGNPRDRVEAARLFSEWLKYFLSELENENGSDKQLLAEIDHYICSRMKKNQINTLVRSAGGGFGGIFTILYNWLKLRKEYNFEAGMIIKTILLYINERKKN